MRCVISDAIEKVFVSFFYYLGYRRFVSRVQVLPTAATQKTFKALAVRCSGETPPGARGIRKFCDNHCTVDQLQLGIVHPAVSQYTYGNYGMHDLSTGVAAIKIIRLVLGDVYTGWLRIASGRYDLAIAPLGCTASSAQQDVCLSVIAEV